MNRVLALVLVVVALGGAAWFLTRGGEPQSSHAATLDGAGVDGAGPEEAAALPSAPRSSEPEFAAAGSEERVALAVAPEAPAESASEATKAVTRVSGEVRDERGAPLADARVVAISGDDPWLFNQLLDADKSNPLFAQFGRQTKTGADGRFSLDLARPGKLMLAVRARGHAPHDETPRSAPAGGALDVGVLTLVAGPYVYERRDGRRDVFPRFQAAPPLNRTVAESCPPERAANLPLDNHRKRARRQGVQRVHDVMRRVRSAIVNQDLRALRVVDALWRDESPAHAI